MSTIIIALAVLAVLFAFLSRRNSFGSNPNVKNVSAEEANDIIKKDKNLIILDVRTKGEYSSGHIPGAKLMPVSDISARLSELEKYRERPVLVYCASGGRSPMAVKVLLKNDFKNIYHLKGGLSRWNYKTSR